MGAAGGGDERELFVCGAAGFVFFFHRFRRFSPQNGARAPLSRALGHVTGWGGRDAREARGGHVPGRALRRREARAWLSRDAAAPPRGRSGNCGPRLARAASARALRSVTGRVGGDNRLGDVTSRTVT